MTRHIANLKFGVWSWRVYLAWDGEGTGDSELAQAMHEIETIVGPTVSIGEEFLQSAHEVFKRHGFQIFKG